MEQRQQQRQQQQQYTSEIADNVEKPCNITITVVGHHGVGKFSFVRQLKQENIPEGGPGSTDTADLFVNYIRYNTDTGLRQKLDENGDIETGRQRLKRIINRYRDVENTSVQPSVNIQNPHGDKGKLSISLINPSRTALPEPTVDAPVVSAKEKAGVKQKLKQFFSKLPFKRKERDIQEVEIPQDVEITQNVEIPQDVEIPQHFELPQEQKV